MFIGYTVILVMPIKYALIIGVPVATVNLILNLMPIMVLRYNTPRLKMLYARLNSK